MDSKDFFKLQNGSDIRGIALNKGNAIVNLTPEVSFKIGTAFTKWLSQKIRKPAKELTIGIGRDPRLSGAELAESLVKGIAFEGAKVVQCGLATTPAMFMSIIFEQTQFDGAVMVTASHLPSERNGFKFFDKDGGLEKNNISSILKTAYQIEVNLNAVSECMHLDLLSLYSDYLKNIICSSLNCHCNEEKPLNGLKIAVDAGNGSGGFFANKILKELGADISGSCFLEPDGNFPNHIPNPEDKTAMDALKNAVLQSKSDLGLIFDTDVDRMSAVLDTGEEINRDAIIALTCAILAPDYPGSTIVTDSVTSDRLTVFLEKELGLKHFRYMRGYKNVINKQKELNAQGIICPLAMETSGHGAFKENYYLDDGAFCAVKLVIALARAKKSGKQLKSLIQNFPKSIEETELRFNISGENFKEYGLEVLEKFKQLAQKLDCSIPVSFEGVRLSFKNQDVCGWLLLRLSLHEPVMPLNIEGARKGDCAKLKKIALELLSNFSRLDISSLKK